MKLLSIVTVFTALTTCLFAEDLQVLESAGVTIGIDKSRGAAITWLSWPAHPKNVVNLSDPGRLIQQSYYAGKSLDRQGEGQSPHWSPWPWNPIQGGGIASWARVTKFERRENPPLLFAETVPGLWDMPDEEAAAIMRQWTAHEPAMPGVIVVRCEFTAKRKANDRWGPARTRHQELPACYFTRKFDRFKSYLGAAGWRLESASPGPPWSHTRPPEKAMACFSADGQGIAVFSPGATEAWNFGPNGKGASDQPEARACVHIAPVASIELATRSTLRYRYWLIVGDESQIARRLDQLIAKYAKERVETSEPRPTPSAPRR